ncbi:hypothetical protein MKW92_039233 [Papaver armeniacum]|nr:hypothetical protein MKW92_039233 [Papaver armeniacum]
MVSMLSRSFFGKKSVWEGGVGLFVVSGAELLALSLAWLRGFQMRSRFRKYQAVLQFTEAHGISTGTAVRIRGVTVGSVIRLNPSLKSIDAVVEETIKGSMGVSLDELVGIFTRLGWDMEVISVCKTFDLAERVASVIEEAKPLLAKNLCYLKYSGLLKDPEGLTRNLTAATADMRKMHSSIMTPESTERLRKSIDSFFFTLKTIEDFLPFGRITGWSADNEARGSATSVNLEDVCFYTC